MLIYLASSWSNPHVDSTCKILEQIKGIKVYNFKKQEPFHFSSVDISYKNWHLNDWLENINSDLCENGFMSDLEGMKASDICICVMPSGRSAHLELGWFLGQGRTGIIYYPNSSCYDIPDLMHKLSDLIVVGESDLVEVIKKI